MAATVLQLAVVPGQQVRAGALLMILEAMKMEHELTAPHDARVVAVLAREGELVSEGDALMQLERADVAPSVPTLPQRMLRRRPSAPTCSVS